MNIADAGVPARDPTVDSDLLELVKLMPPAIRGMKRQALAAREQDGPSCLYDLLSAGSLGPRHLPVIVVLSFEGGLAVGELAERIGLGVAATSIMVGDLARVGIVQREVDERDRRRTLVRLVPDAAADCARFAQERLAPLRRALARMSPDMRAHFLAGWRVLGEEAGTAGADSEADELP